MKIDMEKIGDFRLKDESNFGVKREWWLVVFGSIDDNQVSSVVVSFLPDRQRPPGCEK